MLQECLVVIFSSFFPPSRSFEEYICEHQCLSLSPLEKKENKKIMEDEE